MMESDSAHCYSDDADKLNLSTMATQRKRPSSHDCDREMFVFATVRQKAHAWCKDSIGGSWAKISTADIILKPLTGGMSNYLYLCSLPEGVLTADKEPSTVVIRIYGHIAKESQEFIDRNPVVFELLSEKELSPKFYGNYQDGRIEEYIPTRCLLREELRKEDISRHIAQKLALSHRLDVPLPKEPTWLPQTIGKWLDAIRKNVLDNDRKDDEYRRKLRAFNLDKEFKEILIMVESTDSPVVFCHNDLQEGNILYRESCDDESKKLTLIDWEYCGYGYRGYDLANHFCEWALDYTDQEPPYFSHHPDDFPKKDQQVRFLQEYLEALHPGVKTTDEEVEAMVVEVTSFVPVSHFFWGVWSIFEAQTSCIKFGYTDYALSRLELYFSTKEMMEAVVDSRVD